MAKFPLWILNLVLGLMIKGVLPFIDKADLAFLTSVSNFWYDWIPIVTHELLCKRKVGKSHLSLDFLNHNKADSEVSKENLREANRMF